MSCKVLLKSESKPYIRSTQPNTKAKSKEALRMKSEHKFRYPLAIKRSASLYVPIVARFLLVVFTAALLSIKGAEAAPILEVKDVLHDFGTVSTGTESHCTFTLTNRGDQPLIVEKIRVSCGCIKEGAITERTIPPGKQGYLRATFASPDYRKSVREYLSVYTNDPRVPVTALWVKAEVIPGIGLAPSIANFGVVDVSELPSKQVVSLTKYLQSSPGDKIQIESDSEFLQMELKQVQDKEWILSVSLSEGSPLGPINATVKVTSSWVKTRDLLVLGKIVGEIYADPEEIMFKAPAQQGVETVSGKSQEVEIKSRSEKISKIEVIAVPPSELGVQVSTSDTTQPQRLTVTFKPRKETSLTKTINSQLLLKVHLADGTVRLLRIPVMVSKRPISRTTEVDAK